MASETCLVSDIYWFSSLLIQYVSSRAEREAEIKKEQKSAYLDTFAIQNSYIAYMVCGNSQGGAASFQGGGGECPPAPLNETLI